MRQILVATSRGARRSFLPALLVCLSLLTPLPADAEGGEVETPRAVQVLSVLASTVTVDAGRSDGLTSGTRLEVTRDGEPIATIEASFVAERSASCQIVKQLEAILPGDLVGYSRTDPVPVTPAPAASTPQKKSSANKPKRRSSQRQDPFPNISGTISVGFQNFSDGSERARDFSQSTARINLRAREIGNSPFSMSVRVRGRENRIAEAAGTFSERRDRLYELAMTYEPPDGRVMLQLGRLRSGPLVGFDYLDGILGEYRIKPRFGIGGFYGTRSNIDDLGFESSGQTYGMFFHYQRERTRESPFYADLLLGAIGEYESGEVNREYLSLYGRMGSGSRWTLYHRADIDFNTDWRGELSDGSYQFSNLLVSGTYRFSEFLRFGVSYDQRRRFRDLESRDTPEERFDTRLRDGLRATVYLGRPRGLRGTLSVGQRRLEGTSEDSNTITSSIYHNDVGGWNLLLAADYSSFTSSTSDGHRLGLRARKYFRNGHDIGLTLGSSETSSTLTGLVRENRWLRLSGNSRLPRNFFVLWEVEINDGDDLEGVRSTLQLGYRL